MSSRSAFGALLAISLLSACGSHGLSPAAEAPVGASGSLAPKALQQNNGAQFVEFPLSCSQALGQIGHGTSGTSMWFALPTPCHGFSGGVGRIELATGAITTFNLAANASPLVLAESGGYVWTVDQHVTNKGRNIYRINEDGSYEKFLLPDEISVSALAAGADGNLWFCGSYVENSVTQAAVGNVNPAGVTTVYTVPGTPTPVLTSIASGADGNLWVTDQKNGAILRVTTSDKVTTYSVGGHPLNITDSDKVLVYSDTSVGQLSVMSLSGKYTVYPAPKGEIPGGVARKGHGIVAYIDTTDNSANVGTFDSTNGTYTAEAQAPTSGLRYIFNAPDGNAWFTDGTGHVGAYLKYVLVTNVKQLSFNATTCATTFNASETTYSTALSAESQDTSVVTVSKGHGHPLTTFKATSQSPGSTTILVMDAMQNVVSVPVTVSAACEKAR
jgi:streptogramin lyase